MFFHPNKKKMSFNLTQKDYTYIIFYRLKTKFEFRKIILAKLFFIHGKRKNHLSSHKNRSENVIICMKLKLCLCVCVCLCSATCRPAVRLWSWSWNISGCWSLKRWKPLRLSEPTSSGESPSASKYRCVNKVNSTVVRPYEHTTRIKLWVSSPGIIVKNV